MPPKKKQGGPAKDGSNSDSSDSDDDVKVNPITFNSTIAGSKDKKQLNQSTSHVKHTHTHTHTNTHFHTVSLHMYPHSCGRHLSHVRSGRQRPFEARGYHGQGVAKIPGE